MLNRPKRIVRVELQMPKIGGKIYLIQESGLYHLETGQGSLITMAVTHAGSGSLITYDGVPNELGRFDDEDMPEFLSHEQGTPKRNPEFDLRKGRPIYRATPCVMGSWMLNGAFFHGLTLDVDAGNHAVSPFVSIVWMPLRGTPK